MHKNSPSVLLIDDNEYDRLLYKEWLADSGYQLFEAQDGKEGIAKCLELAPACMVIDFLMPQTDGFQMLIELRRTHQNDTPIIFLSGYQSKELTEDALALGANCFLSKKTLNAGKLKETIDDLISA